MAGREKVSCGVKSNKQKKQKQKKVLAIYTIIIIRKIIMYIPAKPKSGGCFKRKTRSHYLFTCTYLRPQGPRSPPQSSRISLSETATPHVLLHSSFLTTLDGRTKPSHPDDTDYALRMSGSMKIRKPKFGG